MEKKDQVKASIDRKTNLAILGTKVISTSKNILLTLAIALILAYAILKYILSNKKAQKLVDVISDESNSIINKKKEAVEKYDKRIQEIKEDREKKLKEIEEADDAKLDEIIKRRGL